MREHLVSSLCLPYARQFRKGPKGVLVPAQADFLPGLCPAGLMAFPEVTLGIHRWMEGRQVAVGSPGR